MRTKTLWIKDDYVQLILSGQKTVEVRVGYGNITRLAPGDQLLLNDRHLFIIRRVARYATFEELLAQENAAAIAPGTPPDELLAQLRAIYPPEKEALGVVALEIVQAPTPQTAPGSPERKSGALDIVIEEMQPGDWAAVRDIYLEGIAAGNATFETSAPAWDEWDRHHLPVCRLVARAGAQIVGWAALSPVSRRPVYAGVAEVSIYVAAQARGQGVGKALLNALVQASEQNGFWTLQAGIFAENQASLALHKACGFRRVGVREQLGQANGVWRDVVLMERRSMVIGQPA